MGERERACEQGERMREGWKKQTEKADASKRDKKIDRQSRGK